MGVSRSHVLEFHVHCPFSSAPASVRDWHWHARPTRHAAREAQRLPLPRISYNGAAGGRGVGGSEPRAAPPLLCLTSRPHNVPMACEGRCTAVHLHPERAWAAECASAPRVAPACPTPEFGPLPPPTCPYGRHRRMQPGCPQTDTERVAPVGLGPAAKVCPALAEPRGGSCSPPARPPKTKSRSKFGTT